MSHVMLGLWFPRVNICSVSGSRDEMMQWRRRSSLSMSRRRCHASLSLSLVKKRESRKTRSRRTTLPVPFASDATSVFIRFFSSYPGEESSFLLFFSGKNDSWKQDHVQSMLYVKQEGIRRNARNADGISIAKHSFRWQMFYCWINGKEDDRTYHLR